MATGTATETTATTAPRKARSRATPLQTIRRARTMTQRQLAGLVGITQGTMDRYERGLAVPPPDRRAQIAALLGTTAEVLWPPPDLYRRAS